MKDTSERYGLKFTEPENAGFSAERLTRISKGVQKHIDNRVIPGAVSVVARHGNAVHFDVQGMMDIEDGKPMAADTIFRMASMTKPVVCVGLMTLYEEGCFLLDQPISDVLPCFKDMYVRGDHDFPEPANRQITFRDCLTHTAGFSSNEWDKARYRFAPNLPDVALVPGTKETVNLSPLQGTLEEAVEILAKAPLNYHPGTDWEYNPGHAVVGVLIEKLSGQRLDVFLQERILDPLGMIDTHFYLPAEKIPRFAAGYAKDENEWGHIGLIDSPATSAKVSQPQTYFASCGGLQSTATDYARFAQMLLNGGNYNGTDIISRKTLELMTQNHTGELFIYPMGPGYGYGLGVAVKTCLADALLPGSLGTYGWDGAFSTTFFVDPVEDMFGILLTQVRDNGVLSLARKDFTRLVYQALVGD